MKTVVLRDKVVDLEVDLGVDLGVAGVVAAVLEAVVVTGVGAAATETAVTIGVVVGAAAATRMAVTIGVIVGAAAATGITIEVVVAVVLEVVAVEAVSTAGNPGAEIEITMDQENRGEITRTAIGEIEAVLRAVSIRESLLILRDRLKIKRLPSMINNN